MSPSLRTIRIFVSLMVFIFLVLFFIKGDNSFILLIGNLLTYFQFIPSLLHFLQAPLQAPVFGFLLILVLTFFAGRVFCSFLCPLGVWQDIVIFLSGKTPDPQRKKKWVYKPAHHLIRFIILGITVFFFAAGSLTLIDLLDPFSLFGRFATHLLQPIYFFMNNGLVAILEKYDLYYLSFKKFPEISGPVYFLVAVSFLLVFLAAFRHGRLYCNALCPVGSVLGYCSRYARLKIIIDPQTCTGCGKCERRCKAHCLDANRHFVDQSRCVTCFDCLEVCPVNAVKYGVEKKVVEKENPNPGKRKMLIQTASAGGLLVLARFPGRLILQPLISKKNIPVTPPGSLSVDHFVRSCTGCHLCVNICYSRVLQPAFLEYGLEGMLQPIMDFSKGKCAYDCNLCTQVCPTGAILPLTLAEKHRIQIGKVIFEKEKCIVYAKNRDCGACAEVCPTHAVYTETRNNVRYPVLKTESCTGCGACENVCPVRPKAIWVEGHRVHQIAAPPFMQGQGTLLEKPKRENEDFPF
jgi:ferredoxin-type protein NapF